MSESAYLFITFISALISVHMLIWVIDAFIQRPKRSRQVMKEGKWIKIDTSRGGFNQETATSARGAALEFSSIIPRREHRSSRAGHVSLDYMKAQQRKKRRSGLP